MSGHRAHGILVTFISNLDEALGVEFMGRIGQLKNVERQLVKDLTESTVSLQSLGEKYGVTRQAISLFARRKGVKRPKREHAERCSICQRLLAIAKKQDSDFISSQTIHEQLKLGMARIAYHIGVLRRKGLVSWNFGKMRSKNVELPFRTRFKRIDVDYGHSKASGD